MRIKPREAEALAKAFGIEIPKMAKKRKGHPWNKDNKPLPPNKRGVDPLFDALCKSHGLPLPDYEYEFFPWKGGYGGCTQHLKRGDDKCPVCGAWRRLWRFDCLFEGWLAVERNGAVWTQGRHSGGQGQIDDFDKINEAQLLGYIILQFTPQQFNDGSAFAFIKRALERNEL